ncbi:MAG: hypothetical protein JJU19_12720 [Pararhodobacter sp.]|nr:hypothetical protein [Pararhodobacter sp.]
MSAPPAAALPPFLIRAARATLRLFPIWRRGHGVARAARQPREAMHMGLLAVPMALALTACDIGATAGDSPRDAERGVVTTPPVTDLPGTPDLTMARQACGRALAGPDGMMRVEFERPSSVGAVVMLHVWPEEGSSQTRRWRCYFNYDTRRIRAIPA